MQRATRNGAHEGTSTQHMSHSGRDEATLVACNKKEQEEKVLCLCVGSCAQFIATTGVCSLSLDGVICVSGVPCVDIV